MGDFKDYKMIKNLIKFAETLKTCLNYAISISSKAADCLLLAFLLILATDFGRSYLAS